MVILITIFNCGCSFMITACLVVVCRFCDCCCYDCVWCLVVVLIVVDDLCFGLGLFDELVLVLDLMCFECYCEVVCLLLRLTWVWFIW